MAGLVDGLVVRCWSRQVDWFMCCLSGSSVDEKGLLFGISSAPLRASLYNVVIEKITRT